MLFEDDDVIAINKPPGLPSVAPRGSSIPSALSLLTEQFQRFRKRFSIVHRIDKFTSGILLFAKNEIAKERLVEQFMDRKPLREYLAIVRGVLPQNKGVLVHYMKRSGMHQQITSSRDPESGRAELSYVVEERFPNATLVRVSLVTGFQNQIRVQFSVEGYPLIGDRKYRKEEADETRIARVALHAARLEFFHPRTRSLVCVECEIPDDFSHLLRRCKSEKSTEQGRFAGRSSSGFRDESEKRTSAARSKRVRKRR